MNALPVSHPHYPSPRTNTLASLVKGEVLSPEKIRATTGGIAFLPHPFRFSDTSANNPSIVGSASHCNRSSPLHKGAKGDTALLTLLKTALSLAPHHILASLVKGRWIDGKAQALTLLHLLAICSPFLYCKLFCRQDGGIAFLPHPFRFSDTSANNPSIVGSASHCNRSSPLHKGAKGDTALPTLPKPHYPLLCTITLASLVKGRWIDGKAQTVALLLPACYMPTLFILQTFLPSRRRDCFPLHRILLLPQPSQKHTAIPHPAPPLNFSLFPIQHSFPPCIPLTTSADNSIIKAVTSISI